MKRTQMRRVAKVFAGVVCFLVPWSMYMGFTLPTRAMARHYNVAWAGFDGLLILAAGVTAVLAARRSPLVQLPAMATGTLFIVDAWFDVVTAAPHTALVEALVLAFAGEVPLAIFSWWLAARAHRWSRTPALEVARAPLRPEAALTAGRTR
ncbi:MAG TPA: hypothetical protein VJ818_07755 [Actinomycetota bacterium]|nr:hypothetical protein [Actinomycetota bacterium]